MKRSITALCFGVLLLVPWSHADNSDINVTFLNPDVRGNKFWDQVVSFMQASANDLGIELTVIYAKKRTRFEYLELAEEVLSSPEKPDFFISINMKYATDTIFKLIEKNEVPYITINTELPENQQQVYGKPREIYKYWIAQMFPDDALVGYQLAKRLMQKAKNQKLRGEDGKVHIFGVGGFGDASSAHERNRGLKKLVREQGDIVLHQIVDAEWNRDRSYHVTKGLIPRYPDTSVIWSANDEIAQGVLSAIVDSGKIPGRDIIVGGIDWSAESLYAIKAGAMEVSYGGHFMEGGWAMVLLYDYFHGNDFAEDIGSKITTKMSPITSENIDVYLEYYATGDWDKIDFRQFSKTYNPQRKAYDFGLHVILPD